MYTLRLHITLWAIFVLHIITIIISNTLQTFELLIEIVEYIYYLLISVYYNNVYHYISKIQIDIGIDYV